jgi:hypothetical protein
MSLTPYTGYTLLAAEAASGVIDPTPDVLLGDEGSDFTFAPVHFGDALTHRGFFGLRFLSYVFLLQAEVIVSSRKVPLYSMKFGLDY